MRQILKCNCVNDQSALRLCGQKRKQAESRGVFFLAFVWLTQAALTAKSKSLKPATRGQGVRLARQFEFRASAQ